MTNDREHNLRLMLSKLAAFDEGKLALSSLIPELETLFNAVDLADPDWREGFWDAWADLEINYAVGLNRGWTALDKESGQLVSQAVEKMKTLVAARLGEG